MAMTRNMPSAMYSTILAESRSRMTVWWLSVGALCSSSITPLTSTDDSSMATIKGWDGCSTAPPTGAHTDRADESAAESREAVPPDAVPRDAESPGQAEARTSPEAVPPAEPDAPEPAPEPADADASVRNIDSGIGGSYPAQGFDGRAGPSGLGKASSQGLTLAALVRHTGQADMSSAKSNWHCRQITGDPLFYNQVVYPNLQPRAAADFAKHDGPSSFRGSLILEHMSSQGRPWWKDAVFYQIYPRSFQDSNGDGVGDIPGIISRLDQVAALGATALWLSPVYRSPDADNGYDIADYCAIDSRYGSLADFDSLVAEAGKRGIRIVMDLVINHTSDEHPWFQASRRRQEPYADYYIWRTGEAGGRPPNNWTSFFMGSAWQWDEARQAYYLHLFDKKQPDLNYKNPLVIEEIERVMRFWLDRGVAGFRCDVISLLDKESFADGKAGPIWGLEHYKARPGTHQILRRLRREVLEPYGAFTVGETVMTTLDEAREFSDPRRGELDLVFYFDHLEVDRVVAKYVPKPFSAAELLRRLTRWQQGLDWNALVLENHDQPRIVSHYGDDQVFWSRSARLLGVLELTLRGTPFIYQGQEIGMTNFDFTSLEQVDDVESRRMDGLLRLLPYSVRWWLIRTASRDNARTPMQWDDSANAGFTTGRPWLGVNANSAWLNHARQDRDPHSILNFYRRTPEDTTYVGSGDPGFCDFAQNDGRGVVADPAYTIFLNFSGRTQKLKQPWLASAVSVDGAPTATGVRPPTVVASNTGRRQLDGHLLPWEAVIIREAQAAPWHAHQRESQGQSL